MDKEMKPEKLPVNVVTTFQVGQVALSPTEVVHDLFVSSKTTPTSQVHTKRLRLEPGMLAAMAHTLSETAAADPLTKDRFRVQRLLERASIDPLTVKTAAGPVLGFLLTLHQTNNSKTAERPVEVFLAPDQLLAMAGLLQAAISEHKLGSDQAPSSSALQ